MGNPVGPGMFRAALADTPREAFNWRLAFSVICFGLMVSRPPGKIYNGTQTSSLIRDIVLSRALLEE
ncbi:MFS general substrate transporter [Diplocarpon rosae]|nr:MFS general substrate transporter [Diplocarpon rosae]